MPITRQPIIFAIWPTAEPVAPAGARHQHGLPGFWLAHFKQTEIRRQPVEPEPAGIRAERCPGWVHLQNPCAIAEPVVLESNASSYGGDVIALPKIGMPAGNHTAHCPGSHHRADLYRFNIGRNRADPSSHRRVHGHVDIPDENLTGAGLRNCTSRISQVFWVTMAAASGRIARHNRRFTFDSIAGYCQPSLPSHHH